MGVYLNPGAAMLRQGRNSQIYVDKSALIARLNRLVNTERKYACVSRPRRFGKTMAANMVSACYDRTVDGASEFAGLAVAGDPTFDAQRNRYDAVRINHAGIPERNARCRGVGCQTASLCLPRAADGIP